MNHDIGEVNILRYALATIDAATVRQQDLDYIPDDDICRLFKNLLIQLHGATHKCPPENLLNLTSRLKTITNDH